jgi:EmrB/QacA subfamily drug resistance transporter
LFTVFLDATIVNVALPDLQRDFEASESGIQWVVAGYSLTMGMFMMAGGTFGDMRGRRLAYLGGLVLFSLASVACALAPGIDVLAIARGVQGVGAAVLNVSSLALVGAAFPDPAAKARAIGIWTGIAAVGLGLGPLVGGVLTEQLGWRSVFLVTPVVCAAAIVLTLRYVRESSDPEGANFDLVGQTLFVLSIGALTFGLIQGPYLGWDSPVILATFAVAAAALAAFVFYELRTPAPMMELRFFRDRTFSTAVYVLFAVLFAVYGTLLVMTQYFQNVRDYSPEEAGLLTTSLALPVVVVAPLTGRLIAAYGARRTALAGLWCGATGAALLAAGGASRIPVAVLALVLIGIVGALAVAPATSAGMAVIPAERSGMASGILSTQRGVGSTAGFAIMGSVLAAVVAATLPDRLEPYVGSESERTEITDQVSDDANPQAVVSIIGPGKTLPASVKTQDEVLEAADDAFVAGIRVAMLVALAFIVSALALAWFMFPRRGSIGAEAGSSARTPA